MRTILASAVLASVKVAFFPDLNLLLLMFLAMGIDFVTGVIKARVLRIARTSSGFRKSVVKFMQYGIAVAIGAILANIADRSGMGGAISTIQFFDNGLLVFIIYIEATSIFENIYACDTRSKFAVYFIKPVLNLLTFQLKNNPVTQTQTPDENK